MVIFSIPFLIIGIVLLVKASKSKNYEEVIGEIKDFTYKYSQNEHHNHTSKMWTPVIEYRWGGEVCKYDHGVYSSEKQGQIGDKVILLVDITNPEKVTDRRSIRMQKSVGLSFIFVTIVFALFDIFIAAPLLEML